MSKEAYYFSHDANARHDDKILELRAELGWEGYGLFWAVIETLRDCSNYSYPSNAKAGLALSLNIDKTKLEQFVSTCVKFGLLEEKDGVFYSESLMRRMEEVDEKRRKRAEAGRLGGTAKANGKQSSSNAKAKASKESKGKESKVEETIPEKFPFESFWNGFKKKEGSKKDTEKKWIKLSEKTKEIIMAGLNIYAASFSDRQFQPYPETFLNKKYWEAESYGIAKTSIGSNGQLFPPVNSDKERLKQSMERNQNRL